MKRPYSASFTSGLLVLSAFAFIGCGTLESVQKSHTPPIAERIPESWSNQPVSQSAAASVSLAQWWNRFEDPVLSDLIEDALESNPDIRSALSAIRQAQAQRNLTAAQLWPAASGSVGASGSRVKDRSTDSSDSSENYSAAINASWEVDLFGRQAKYLSATDAELAGSIENFHDAQVSLAAEVANTYLTLRSLEIQLVIVKQNLSTRESTHQIIEWQDQAGEGDGLSIQQSIASVEQARARIPELEQSIEETRNSIAVLTGRPPAALQSFQLSEEFPVLSDGIAVGIPAETLNQRPDIRSAEQRIAAAEANLTATERSRLPSLNLSGSIGIEALKAGKLFDPRQIIANGIASLSAPLWDAGRITRNIEIQKENLTQAYLYYEAKVLTALSEVENALSAIKQLEQQLATLERASAAARAATQLAQIQYKSGETDLLTVLDTQRTELTLEQDRITIQSEALQAHVQLYKALGGGWSTPSEFSTL